MWKTRWRSFKSWMNFIHVFDPAHLAFPIYYARHKCDATHHHPKSSKKIAPKLQNKATDDGATSASRLGYRFSVSKRVCWISQQAVVASVTALRCNDCNDEQVLWLFWHLISRYYHSFHYYTTWHRGGRRRRLCGKTDLIRANADGRLFAHFTFNSAQPARRQPNDALITSAPDSWHFTADSKGEGPPCLNLIISPSAYVRFRDPHLRSSSIQMETKR